MTTRTQSIDRPVVRPGVADVEQHPLVKSVVLHLLPGILTGAVFYAVAPAVMRAGYPAIAGAVIAVGMEAYAVVAEERAAVQAERARAERRRNLSQEVLAQADGIVASALSAVRKDLDDVFKPEFQRIDVVARSIHGARGARSELRERLSFVQQGASEALAALSPSSEQGLLRSSLRVGAA